MPKLEKVDKIVGIIAGALTILTFVANTARMIPDITNYLGLVSTVFIVVFIAIWCSRRRKETTIDPRFVHLTIHYSQRTDTPDTPNPTRPRYVENKETNQAYWVSDLIEPYAKQHLIEFCTWDGARALRAYFRRRKISVSENNPRRPEDLGLRFDRKGALPRRPVEPGIVSKLGSRKLDDLEDEWLFPWYYVFLPDGKRHDPPNKRLLRKISTGETYRTPIYDVELYRKRIIGHDNYLLFPFESLEGWSERHGYTYRDRRFTEHELMEET